ncbi:MAG: hypothetical protein V5789_03960 [Colwellia sp.]
MRKKKLLPMQLVGCMPYAIFDRALLIEPIVSQFFSWLMSKDNTST